MTTARSIGNSAVLDELSIENRNQAANERVESDKDMFMRLMLAQMKNQNPLNPQDGTQFLSQLAQFSQLEGIGKVNSSIQDMSSLFRSTQTLQATTMVGREVLMDGREGHFDGNSAVSGIIKDGQPALDVNMRVVDAKGATVFNRRMGDISGSEVPLTWDGKDASGNAVPPGNYTFVVEGRVGGKTVALNTAMNERVSSVSVAPTGMMLNLAGGASISADKVTRIR